ncbi:hypothetical protein BDV96DRAFT_598876 [Lophiotrema nucula]|uniref:DUF7730 domain-containing protein n=1 Tax=Lophiotrema nucula TaxID=690887 RepID=A0A6A5ZAK3_9PLEO|nr:hypothetical protein BDV96DRAFT_598876 [Lophiotrema nucula]
MADQSSDWPLRNEIPHRESFNCPPSHEQASKKGLLCLPSFDPLPGFDYMSEGPRSSTRWNPCFLLSLPKELRLEIWKYVLTDTSSDDLVVHIQRLPTTPCYKLERPLPPSFSITHEGRRSASISTSILRTSRFIYEEALPVLYNTTTFYPGDLEGLLPLFLKTLSPFAQSHIRRIKLRVPTEELLLEFQGDLSRPLFHWAVTCAQVAKLSSSLREVEVCGDISLLEGKPHRRAKGVLHPLCKIKTLKVFTQDPNHLHSINREALDSVDSLFQRLLAEAEEDLRKAAKTRKERTEAEAEERAKRSLERERRRKECPPLDHNTRFAYGGILLKSSMALEELQSKSSGNQCQDAGGIARPPDNMEEWCRWAEENLRRMEADLSRVPGIEQFEKELEDHSKPQSENPYSILEEEEIESPTEDWELIDTRSGTSTPRARSASVLSKHSDEEWTDTASTLVGKDDMCDTADEDWEHLG